MRKLTSSQRDFLLLSLVGFLLYEGTVRYQWFEILLKWIVTNEYFNCAALMLIFGSMALIYSVRRWKDQAKVNRKLRNISMLDELTGLYNRRGFFTLCTQQLRRNKMTMHLLYADLDNMKWINDQLGHHVGDHALVRTSSLLRQSFTKAAVISRLGGDEFAVLIPGAPRKLVDRMIREFQNHVEQFNMNNKQNYHLSVSIGLAQYDPNFPSSLMELMAYADQAMYEQKLKNKEIVPHDSKA